MLPQTFIFVHIGTKRAYKEKENFWKCFIPHSPPSKELLSEIHPNVLILQNNSLHFCNTIKSKYSKWLHELILEMPLKCKEKKCEINL